MNLDLASIICNSSAPLRWEIETIDSLENFGHNHDVQLKSYSNYCKASKYPVTGIEQVKVLVVHACNFNSMEAVTGDSLYF